MSDDELVPFAESLGLADGRPLELAPYQRALLSTFQADVQAIDRGELALAARHAARRQAAARALAVAALQGVNVRVASTDAASARRLYQLAIDELELIGRTFDVDVTVAVGRLRAAN